MCECRLDRNRPVTLDRGIAGHACNSNIMSNSSFADGVCETFKCRPEEATETVFWLCVYPQAIPLARLLWHLHRGYFAADLEFIERVSRLTSPAEVRLEFSRFRYYQPVKGVLRRFLKVRISGKRLLELADQLFARRCQPSLVSSRVLGQI